MYPSLRQVLVVPSLSQQSGNRHYCPLKYPNAAWQYLIKAIDTTINSSYHHPLDQLVLAHCQRWQQANRALSAQVILIIVASLALGSALMKTGGAEYLAQVFCT